MTRRMLIDATHPEETRVTVVSGNRLEEFDYETTTKQQVKGNIYLAKVTRVEPSLQAAFVEYGGNRHGFLAFSEIHPDYYRIPIADREELVEDDGPEDEDDTSGDTSEPSEGQEATEGEEEGDAVENVGEAVEEDVEEAAKRRPRLRRQYKIQEVVKRRQVMLVQVVKEERGNKGAALTTYLSLAGRYCVVMPNTSRGGGVSRKIANVQDRKRLKTILADLDVPEGMAVILRTAGAERSKAEVKRDFEYIMRLWDDIREKTLDSTAPSLIHEEGNLVKRAIRDLYTKDIEEVLVSGDEGYRAAKDLMKALTPSHAKKVQPYKDEQGIPLFHRYQVEQQLVQIHEPTVQLKSGGSIVIHQTEALVAIDVNSGKATRERHIEETALKTNLEAADEVARQLRLRDLAGLIVIDFIDMDENRHDHAVERRLKEALRRDRARIQVGRISAFGLMEMSRQRLRPSLLEAMSQPCHTCGGTGYIVGTEAAALMVTRSIEEEGLRKRASEVTVRVPGSVALYILNQKRSALIEMEERYGFSVVIEAADGMLPPQFEIVRGGITDGTDEEEREDNRSRGGHSDGDSDDKNRRRNRRGGRRRGRRDEEEAQEVEQTDETGTDGPDSNDESSGEDGEDRSRRRRRRGRRGGRRRGRGRGDADNAVDDTNEGGEEPGQADDSIDTVADEDSSPTGEEETKPKRRRRGRKPKSETETVDSSSEAPVAAVADDQVSAEVPATSSETDPEPDAKPAKKAKGRRKKAAAAKPEPAEAVVEEAGDTDTEKPSKTAKKSRTRRKKAAAAKPEPAEAAEAVSDGASSVAAATNDAPQVVSEPISPAPQPEASPSNPTPVEATPDKDKPKRKGWWNRVLG